MDAKPLWKQILSEEGKRLFQLKVGPTIPFLVGAYYHKRLLSDDDLNSRASLRKVFHEITTTEPGAVGITICPHLGVEVVRITTSPGHNPLFASNLDEYIDNLWERYGRYISSRKFSIDTADHSWREFDETEKEQLNQLKSY